MMEKREYSLFGFLCAAVVIAAMLTVFAHVAKAELVPLEVTDCVKCHEDEPATIARNGGKHKTEVTCLDCHQEHPPWGENTIPKCSMCHEGRSHFELENCLSCRSGIKECQGRSLETSMNCAKPLEKTSPLLRLCQRHSRKPGNTTPCQSLWIMRTEGHTSAKGKREKRCTNIFQSYF